MFEGIGISMHLKTFFIGNDELFSRTLGDISHKDSSL